MVLGVEVSEICWSWGPIDVELALADPILDPIESHVDSFGADLFASLVGDGDSSGVVDLDWSSWLRVAHFCEHDADWDSLFAIVEKGTNFSLCCGGHDIADDFGYAKEGTVAFVIAFVAGAKEVVAANTTAGFGLGQVGGITVDSQGHVAGNVGNIGIGVGGTVVEEVGHGADRLSGATRLGCC